MTAARDVDGLGERTASAGQRGRSRERGPNRMIRRRCAADAGARGGLAGPPIRVHEDVALGAGLAAVGRVRAGEFAPLLAGNEALSSEQRPKSTALARPSRSSSARWSRSKTPAACQSRSLRQQAMPEPEPISRDLASGIGSLGGDARVSYSPGHGSEADPRCAGLKQPNLPRSWMIDVSARRPAASPGPAAGSPDQGDEQEERGHDGPTSHGLAQQVRLARIEVVQGQHDTVGTQGPPP